MTTEENKHKEEVVRATQLWECGDITREQLEYIFPQLAESEYEKNIKDLIDELKGSLRAANCQNDACGGGHEKRIALLEWGISWLEKMGEDKEYTFKSIPRLLDMIEPSVKAKFYCQNLIDTLTKEGYNTDAKIIGECLKGMNGEKVAMATMDEKKQSPKFKVGDWICNNFYSLHITVINDGKYYFNSGDGYSYGDIKFINNNYHLWSIADAKPGDVLAFEPIHGFPSPFIALYKGLYKNSTDYFYSYCFVSHIGDFCIDNDIHNSKNIHPATEEQRKLLFEKMAEAGYEWDDEKKDFKITDFSKHLKYNTESPSIIEQKPAWSKEDEYNLQCIIAKADKDIQNGNVGRNQELIDWLKSVKERVQPQPKQDGKWKWDEDDKKFSKNNIFKHNK